MNIRENLGTIDKSGKTEYADPYVLIFKTKNNTNLVYFGANHSTDMNDPQYPILKELWNKFIERKQPQNCVVLVSGGIYRPIDISDEEAIKKDAEAGLITKWAHDNGVELISPEPNMKEVCDELEKKYTRDEIEYYFFARVVAQWHRFQQKPDFESYITRFLAMDKEDTGWTDYDFTFEHMKEIHKHLFNKEFDLSDENLFKELSDPYADKTVINSVGHEENLIRDESIVKSILECAKDSKNIFIVYGSAHAIVQEEYLKKTLAS